MVFFISPSCSALQVEAPLHNLACLLLVRYQTLATFLSLFTFSSFSFSNTLQHDCFETVIIVNSTAGYDISLARLLLLGPVTTEVQRFNAQASMLSVSKGKFALTLILRAGF